MSIITMGMDLAKNIFAVHGVNENGKAELVKPSVARAQLLPLIAKFGIVLPQKIERLRRGIGAHLEDLPGCANRCMPGGDAQKRST